MSQSTTKNISAQFVNAKAGIYKGNRFLYNTEVISSIKIRKNEITRNIPRNNAVKYDDVFGGEKVVEMGAHHNKITSEL